MVMLKFKNRSLRDRICFFVGDVVTHPVTKSFSVKINQKKNVDLCTLAFIAPNATRSVHAGKLVGLIPTIYY